MKEVYNFKRAFIITDSTLYQLGACDAIINQLRDMGIETAEFFDIRVDPQIQDAMKGLPKMHEFEPDVIIAVGGGSAIDTAKIMWIMYEHPEEGFLDMATTFLKTIAFIPSGANKQKIKRIDHSKCNVRASKNAEQAYFLGRSSLLTSPPYPSQRLLNSFLLEPTSRK